MLNISQTVVDNLSPEGQLEVAGHTLNAAQATIRDLGEQLIGAKVLLRATSAALRSSQAHVDQLMVQVKEQAADVRVLRAALSDMDCIVASKSRTIQRQATALQQLHQETGRAEVHARGHDQMVDLLAEDRMWNAMLGTWAREVDWNIRQGGECNIAAIRRIRSETGLGTLVCRALTEKRAEYL